MKTDIRHCTLCPRACGADRTVGVGRCGEGDTVRVAKTMLHRYEEPLISGTRGSGAVFFSGCALGCGYCQNADIWRTPHDGKKMTEKELTQTFLALQNQGAHNINLVTAAHFVPQVAAALKKARKNGLIVPIVYNTSAYETVSAIAQLDGLVDIFLPDYKYADAAVAEKYSAAPDYPEVAASAIEQMLLQVGLAKLDKDGLMCRGVLIRHLVLPGNRQNSLLAVETIARRFLGAQISLMRQYTPDFNCTGDKNLDRRVTSFEYQSVLKRVQDLGLGGYMQGTGAAERSFTPDF